MESSTPPDVAISRARICLGAGLAAGALLIAGCGSSSTSRTAATMPTVAATTQPAQSTVATAEGNARIVSGSAGEVKATLRAGTHTPKVNAPWPISFTVTSAGVPAAAAAVSYEYMFGGAVVARRSHYSFKGGHFSDVFRFPASAVGYPLTFRAVVTSGGATVNLDYPVKVAQ